MNKQPEEIHLKVPDALGDTVVSTAVVHALHDAYPESKLVVYAKNIPLLQFMDEINDLRSSNEAEGLEGLIDISNFLDKRPQTTQPYQHFTAWVINEAEEKLREKGIETFLKRNYMPEVILTEGEKYFGAKKVNDIRRKYEKPVVWISTKTVSPNKNWPQEYWSNLIDITQNDYAYLELLAPNQEKINERVEEGRFEPRESLAAIRYSDAGITLDTFTLHGAAAVAAGKVITILGSSNPAAISYPGFVDMFVKSAKTAKCQPCAHHGYFEGESLKQLEQELGVKFNDNRCIFAAESADEYACMKQIKPEMVADALRRLV